MNLPVPLHCLTLQHIIDAPDAVEGYLVENPEAVKCLPIVLRDVFFGGDAAWDLPECRRIPSAQTTLNYLRALWVNISVYNAAESGMAYLIPYVVHIGEYLGGYLSIPEEI